jgi:putative phage-type endonuclease
MNAAIDLAERTKFLGSSDAAPILGLSPWRSALEVYHDKITPRSLESDRSKERLFARGKRLEPIVCDMLADEEGLTIAARNQRYQDPEHPFLAAEIDAETSDGRNVEIKTVSPFAAKEWGEERSDQIPLHYCVQVLHALMVTGRAEAIVAALIGADDLRVYRVERDDELIARIRAEELAFWDRIQRRDPPPVVTLADAALRWPASMTRTVVTSPEIAEKIESLKILRGHIKELEDTAERLELIAKSTMGDADTLLTPDGQKLCTWKSQSANRIDQKALEAAHPDIVAQFKRASTFRVFRLSK